MRDLTSEVELKPCPFCGGKAKLMLKFVPFGDDEGNQYHAGCPECDIWFWVMWNKEEVVRMWNERVT